MIDSAARPPGMIRWQYYTLVAVGVICLACSVAAILTSRANQHLQTEIQSQQIEINKGAMSQQVGSNLLRDIGAAAAKSDKLRDLLSQNGYSFSEASPSPSPAP